MAAKRERSSALEKSPAFPETPPSRAALSSCTSPRSQRCRNTVSCSVGAIQSRDDAGGRNRVAGMPSGRSEERRVGKECRCRWEPCHEKRKASKELVRGVDN